jgi:hypothetical protein
MFQHLFSRQQRPQPHAKEAIFLSHATTRPLVRWLLPASLAAVVALVVWFIAYSDGLSAATLAPIMLQPPSPISVDGGQFGLAAVGSTQTYTHTVTSHSLLPQTVTLTATTYKGWTVSVSPASLVLNAGASATAVVKMTIPSDALPGTLDVATLTASAGVAKASGKDSLLVKTGKRWRFRPLKWAKWSMDSGYTT